MLNKQLMIAALASASAIVAGCNNKTSSADEMANTNSAARSFASATVSNAWQNTKEGGSNAWQATESATTNAWDATKEAGSNAWATTKQALGGSSATNNVSTNLMQ